jgi:hypothetical protein
MFMNSNLQNLFYYEIINLKKINEAFDSNGVGIKDNPEFKALNCTSWDICKLDICKYVTYLAMTQGKLNSETVKLISYLYDRDFSEDELMSKSFCGKKTSALFFCHAVKIDKMVRTDFSDKVKEIYFHIAGIVGVANNSDEKILPYRQSISLQWQHIRKNNLDEL